MNWKNRLRRVEEDADEDDEDGEENDDDDDDDDNDDDDDYDDYEGVLNGGLAEFRLLFLRRSSAGYALDAKKLLTKPKDGGRREKKVTSGRFSHVENLTSPATPVFHFSPKIRFEFYCCRYRAIVAVAAADTAAVLPPRLPRRTCRECRRSYLENRRGIEDRP
ncbi:ATPase family AAA domain-containing protein 2-like [Temnothorax curvispinosus]|uniref:ATPase family AAA domain-containing protein 2-like n=1 Tax=Temnothorax curvispinosus TaxID=300111 RepID=A0A6J1R7K2_9HYME|nr:ATPase family AAA domain-containing protein 2-like [Temnothorax curvispinosus]